MATTQSVFFIVGSPRSGTTLLRTMLCAHPKICVPHESEFFMRVRAVRGIELLREVEGYVRSVPFQNQEIGTRRLLEGVASGRLGTRGAVFLAMMAEHARVAQKPLVEEKSPHHCRHVEAIARELPMAKFIHIQRDPRDVVASRMMLAWSRSSAAACARSWAGIAREHRRLQRVLPADRYTSVAFESLVTNPGQELTRLCGFLGEEMHAEMLDFSRKARGGQERAEAAWAGVTLKALEPHAVGRYRERLTDRQIDAVQRMAGREMRIAGYTPVRVAAGWGRRAYWDATVRAEMFGERLRGFGRSVCKRLGVAGPGPEAMAWPARG